MRLTVLLVVAVILAACGYARRERPSAERALAAVLSGDEAELRRELDLGLGVNSRDDSGRTLLFHAVGCHRAGCTSLLLARGAAPDAQDLWGWTALMAAAAVGDLPMTRTMLEAGADPGHVAAAGHDAESAARIGEHLEVADLLRRSKWERLVSD